MRELPPPFAPLAAYRQFGIYFTRPRNDGSGKLDKFPADFRTGLVVDAHDPAYWTDANTAIACAINFGGTYGVRFTFTDNDPFFFVDLDNAILPDGSGWKDWALGILQYLNGAAVEISVSGTGLHIFGVGRPPAHGCESKYDIGGFYHNLRYVALTGIGATGNAALNLEHLLPGLVDMYWKPSEINGDVMGWSDVPTPEWRGPTDDEDLLRRMMNSRSASASFGGKATFADLWTANIEALSRTYPPSHGSTTGYNESDADSALVQHLAFWTGRNHARIERLMYRSGLVREKFDRKDNQYGTYLRRTIMMSCGIQFEVLTDKAPEPLAGSVISPAPSITNEPLRPTLVTGSTFANNEEQLNLFSGCVYIQDQHRVLVPGGVLLKPEQFKVAYGGYSLTMDAENNKTTKDAWEAFTQSQAYRCPRATSTCFKPNKPSGALINVSGQLFANTYWPVDVPRKVGDATPFLNHLAKLIPNERTRLIALSYMAACVQYQGYKFQWALFIQGVQGNGKTLLTRCVVEAIGRRYVHWPKASKLTNQFNGWMVGKTFYAVEDIYVSDHRLDVMEEMKPMITGGDGLEIEGKGVDQYSADICGNFMINANTQSSLIITDKERRYCPIFTAQQVKADLQRDGMTGSYMPDIYNWLRLEGHAIVSELLHTFPIPPEFNPAVEAGGLANVAPITDSTHAAIKASTGGVEQEIQEAIEQGLPGFSGGWVSSIQLDLLLEKIGAARRVPRTKRKEMLEGMGYGYHPAFVDGRVNNNVLPDAGKPRLFIRNDAPARNIASAIEASQNYEQTNNHTRTPFPMY